MESQIEIICGNHVSKCPSPFHPTPQFLMIGIPTLYVPVASFAGAYAGFR